MIAHDGSNDAPEGRGPRPLVALLLSLITTGAGHLYVGRWRKGLALSLIGTALFWIALLAGVASTFSGMVLLVVGALAYWGWVAVSAALEARRARGAGLWRRRWFAVAALIVWQVALGGLPLRSWLPVRAFRIPSGSMEPAIQVGDHLIADMRAWSRREPQRGELVIHRSPESPGRLIVRRVIGLPGDRLEIRDKRVYIDGSAIEDPWATHSDPRTFADGRFYPPQVRLRDQFGPLVVPEGSLFLLGDNRDNSNDSRFQGPIDRSLLVGRPLYVYWSRDRSRIGLSLHAAVSPPEGGSGEGVAVSASPPATP